MLTQHVQVPDAVARKGERSQRDPELARKAHARPKLAVRGVTGAPRIAEDRVREAVAADLLGD